MSQIPIFSMKLWRVRICAAPLRGTVQLISQWDGELKVALSYLCLPSWFWISLGAVVVPGLIQTFLNSAAPTNPGLASDTPLLPAAPSQHPLLQDLHGGQFQGQREFSQSGNWWILEPLYIAPVLLLRIKGTEQGWISPHECNPVGSRYQ